MGCKHELPGLLHLSDAEQNMRIRFDSRTDLGIKVSEVIALGSVTLVLYPFVSSEIFSGKKSAAWQYDVECNIWQHVNCDI